MPTTNTMKIETKRKNLYLRVSKGHFATNNSHSNYYIDVAAQKSRLSEAKAVAEELERAPSHASYAPDRMAGVHQLLPARHRGRTRALQEVAEAQRHR